MPRKIGRIFGNLRLLTAFEFNIEPNGDQCTIVHPHAFWLTSHCFPLFRRFCIPCFCWKEPRRLSLIWDSRNSSSWQDRQLSTSGHGPMSYYSIHIPYTPGWVSYWIILSYVDLAHVNQKLWTGPRLSLKMMGIDGIEVFPDNPSLSLA
jgi:hypothetical protein